MAVVVVTAPTEEPIAAAGPGGALEHVHADAADAVYVQGLVMAARVYAEGFQERALVTQTLELTLDAWPTGPCLVLPRPPLESVESIKYRLADGSEVTWDASNYIVDPKSQPGRVALAYGKCWPAVTLQPVNGITVRYVAGYGDAAKVPQTVKQAMFLTIGHWFENRETVVVGTVAVKIPMAAEALLWQGKVFA